MQYISDPKGPSSGKTGKLSNFGKQTWCAAPVGWTKYTTIIHVLRSFHQF